MYSPEKMVSRRHKRLGARQNKESVIAKLRPPTKDLEPDSLLIAWDILLDG